MMNLFCGSQIYQALSKSCLQAFNFFFSPVITIESELPQFILISVWIERLSMGILIYQRS